ncbi:hypothetical protein ACIBQ5_16205 [Streptomyces massasporeus]|uniref:hypothetical protein n=1 Tax=Streptomyces massasporeus TaxID=67324 RepID=UPI0037A73456
MRQPFEELHAETAGLGVPGDTHAWPAVAVVTDRDARSRPFQVSRTRGEAAPWRMGVGDHFRDERFGGLDHPVLVQRAAETFQ